MYVLWTAPVRDCPEDEVDGRSVVDTVVERFFFVNCLETCIVLVDVLVGGNVLVCPSSVVAVGNV